MKKFNESTKLFPITKPLDEQLIHKIIIKHWNQYIKETDNFVKLKASQNYTFQVGDKFIARVTYDADNSQYQKIVNECHFLQYLEKNGMSDCVCTPISPYIVSEDNLIIMVTRIANGKSVDYTKFTWMNDEKIAKANGTWLAKLHQKSRQYAKDFPKNVECFQEWDDLHFYLMKGFPLDENDKKFAEDPDRYGIIHCDINPSNYFYNEATNGLDVFDWDQCSKGWYFYDLAQPIFGVVMLEGAGFPFNIPPVPTNLQQYLDWIVTAYEEESKAPVDRVALMRMIELRKSFYFEFCRRGVKELENCSVEMEHMKKFLEYIVAWGIKDGKIN